MKYLILFFSSLLSIGAPLKTLESREVPVNGYCLYDETVINQKWKHFPEDDYWIFTCEFEKCYIVFKFEGDPGFALCSNCYPRETIFVDKFTRNRYIVSENLFTERVDGNLQRKIVCGFLQAPIRWGVEEFGILGVTLEEESNKDTWEKSFRCSYMLIKAR